jgi:hypothetical protein
MSKRMAFGGFLGAIVTGKVVDWGKRGRCILRAITISWSVAALGLFQGI